jgi:REP element-mobilizing transposase RayT
MARGIAGDRIFQNDFDRDDFLNRLGTLTRETETRRLAWALMSNHFHVLMKTGQVPVAKVMQQLLIGAGLIRGCGSWATAMALWQLERFQKSDERILGDGEFVERMLAGAGEQMQRK